MESCIKKQYTKATLEYFPKMDKTHNTIADNNNKFTETGVWKTLKIEIDFPPVSSLKPIADISAVEIPSFVSSESEYGNNHRK